MCTDFCKLVEFDVKTVTKEELDFDADFSVKVNRSDYCHALVAFFDITFSQCHKPVHFSTGPHAQYTHWKQTVFYLKVRACPSDASLKRAL